MSSKLHDGILQSIGHKNAVTVTVTCDCPIPTVLNLFRIKASRNWSVSGGSSVSQSSPTLCNPEVCSLPGFSVHGDSPGKNTGVGCHFLLQGIFPTQGSNLTPLTS